MEKKHQHYSEYHDIRGDGAIVIYKRVDHQKPRYTARIKAPKQKGYIVKSTKCFALDDAKSFAKNLYYELEGKAARGESLTSKKFAKTFREWASYRRANYSDLAYTEGDIRAAEIHILPFFKDSAIGAVDKALAREFLAHRITSGTKKPSNSTLKQDARRLRSILQFAYENGDIPAIPRFENPKAKPNARPAFTKREWEKLSSELRKRTNAAKNHAAHYRDRFYLWHYVLTLSNSGLRTGEAQKLTWADISSVKVDDADSFGSNKRITLHVNGKTGVRNVVCLDWYTRVLERLKDFRTTEIGREPEENEPIFCHSDGKPIKSFKRSFQSLLDALNLTYNQNNKKRVLYSIRHTYATFRIEEGVGVYPLAQNMGTSVEMIERYYGKATTTSPKIAKELTQGGFSKKGKTK
tara:strand:+ start:733 stop:1959 length:1227 start_codon:yes stop_codon:yes gene_type:complete